MANNLTGAPENYVAPKHSREGTLDGTTKKIGIICAKFNERITKSLLMGAISGLTQHGVNEDNIHTYWVPGAFEVPVVAENIFPKYDAIIAIACVIKGETPHFNYVCNAITQGMTLANSNHKKTGIFCVLTTNNQQEAEDRAQPQSKTNKGYEAALSAIEMITLLANET